MSTLTEVLKLHALGWQTVAAPFRGKSPLGSWRRWQTERVPERHVREAFGDGQKNVFIITGAVSRLAVLDCDTEAAYRFWRERLGPVLDETTRVPTSRGAHYYFRLEEGQHERGRSSHDGDIEWDLRADGGGVIAPPSVHASGRIYRWDKDHGPEAIRPAPAELFEKLPGEEADAPRSMLTHLLEHPPAGEGSGRNNWLTQVAGHYARHFPFQDAYEQHVRAAANTLEPPLPEEEISKLIRSIWNTEMAKEGKAAPEVGEGADWRENLTQPAEETGWLVSGDARILVQTRSKVDREDGGRYELALSTWMDADLRVIGIVDGEERIYGVELRFPDGAFEEDVLPSSTASDQRKLDVWLANHGVSIGPPDNMWPYRMKATTRLVRYLEAQRADVMVAADALGWDEDSRAFITHEGIIRADGPRPFEHVRPDPTLRNWAPYRYGHRGREEAQRVLAEVLDFHDETVAAVFGSWWAACLLKPQISVVTSQFPFMALEAASESGKTTGFFSLMMQLSGNRGGQSNPTRAALRDYLSAHKSGIVWMDDLDDLDAHGELLRNVTVEGAMVKKGYQNKSQVVAQLRAALIISGESLGLEHQKALLDRAILLEVPSPIGRMSRKGNYPQWDDILELKSRYPDLTDFAGSMVELALGYQGMARDVKRLRKGTGRFSDKIAILRLGARILRRLSREEWVVPHVDSWTAREIRDHTDSENVLTLKLLPLVLRATGWRRRPEGPDEQHRMTATPAFVSDDDGCVWFSPRLLAEWWERQPYNRRIDKRTESANSLIQQARALGLGGRKGADGGRRPFRFITGDGTQIYWKVPEPLSTTLIERSQGAEQ